MSNSMVNVGAIDIGTNSTNALVMNRKGIVERVVTVTRLGEGVDRLRRLNDGAISRTIDALLHYRRLFEQHGVTSYRLTASSATRDAANQSEFIARVHQSTGFSIEVISGEEEAALSYRGALHFLAPDDRGTMIIDIGGGSTEFAAGLNSAIRWSESIDIGAVRLTERHLRDDPPRPEDLTNAIGDAADLVDDLIRRQPDVVTPRRVVGIAGTVVTVAAVELGVNVTQIDQTHGFKLTRSAVEDVFRTLATERLADRVHNPGLHPDRADVIVGGCCVLVAIMRRLSLDSLIVSTSGILDGMCVELLTQGGHGA